MFPGIRPSSPTAAFVPTKGVISPGNGCDFAHHSAMLNRTFSWVCKLKLSPGLIFGTINLKNQTSFVTFSSDFDGQIKADKGSTVIIPGLKSIRFIATAYMRFPSLFLARASPQQSKVPLSVHKNLQTNTQGLRMSRVQFNTPKLFLV